jgi:hypothetical protein
MSNIKLLRVIASMDPKTGGPPNGINYITPFLNEQNIETTILCLDNPEESFIKNFFNILYCIVIRILL